MAAAAFSELMNLAFVAAIAALFIVVSIRRPPPIVLANAGVLCHLSCRPRFLPPRSAVADD
jgi:hypothetical protein